MSDTGPQLDRASTRFAVAVVSIAALALWFGSFHIQRKPPWLYGAWACAAYGALPLAAAVFLDARRRSTRGLVVVAGLIAWVPLGWRAWVDGTKALFREQPELVLLPALGSVVLSVSLAHREGIDLARWGAGVGDWRWWGPRTLGLVLATVILVVSWAAVDPAMRAHYPSYDPARTDVRELWGLVASFTVYMAAWEFFFRGFLLFGIARTAGPVHAILFQAVPFLLLHRGAPESEFVLSFVGGALLAVFCWRARSFWPAAILHFVLNAGMQLVCFYWPS